MFLLLWCVCHSTDTGSCWLLRQIYDIDLTYWLFKTQQDVINGDIRQNYTEKEIPIQLFLFLAHVQSGKYAVDNGERSAKRRLREKKANLQ